jgi:hypothetical protein
VAKSELYAPDDVKPLDQTREKLGNPSDLQLIQKAFDRMK